MSLCLMDMVSEVFGYSLDPATGSLTKRRISDVQEFANKSCGFGSMVKCGVLKREVVPVAYCENDGLKLVYIAGNKYNFTDGNLRAVRRAPAPFIRSFVISKSSAVQLKLRYWFFGIREWPDDGDIFSLIIRNTA